MAADGAVVFAVILVVSPPLAALALAGLPAATTRADQKRGRATRDYSETAPERASS